jgi:hypothetical protein
VGEGARDARLGEIEGEALQITTRGEALEHALDLLVNLSVVRVGMQE